MSEVFEVRMSEVRMAEVVRYVRDGQVRMSEVVR